MKKRILALFMMLCLLVLCGCQAKEPERFEVVTQAGPVQQNIYGTQPAASSESLLTEPDFDNGEYDPSSEEGAGLGEDGRIEMPVVETTATPAPTVRSEYAGATPVVIDPIDKPTPTPAPPISFTYQAYDATKLHLSFEGPVGWIVDDSGEDSYILTNPTAGVDYAAQVTIYATPVNENYNESAMKREVKQMLDTIGGELKNFSPTSTANRTLIDKTGVYANYTATTADGAKIAGRVHVTCINKVLYGVHISYPATYTETYKDTVYAKLRETIRITQ